MGVHLPAFAAVQAEAAQEPPVRSIGEIIDGPLKPIACMVNGACQGHPVRRDWAVNLSGNRITIDLAVSAYQGDALVRRVGGVGYETQRNWLVARFADVRAVPAQIDPLLSVKFTFERIGNAEPVFRYMTGRNFMVHDAGFGDGGATFGSMHLDDAQREIEKHLTRWIAMTTPACAIAADQTAPKV